MIKTLGILRWEEWSLSTQWPLSADLILTGRDDEATQILRWLREKPASFTLQAESADEGIAFLHAAIQQLPEDYRAPYHARCLVVTSNDAARMLAGSLSPLIIALIDPEPGLAQRLVKHGHHVYVVCGPDTNASAEVVHLPRASRDALEHALTNMGIDKEKADGFARDSGRSLAILRRLIPASPARDVPEWADSKFTRSLITALFAGAWDENRTSDKKILERLADKTYDKIIEDLTPFLGTLDSPIRKVGNTWKVSSPRDAWFFFAQRITQADFNRLNEVITEVLGTIDPRFEMKADERWFAGAKGISPEYSKALRRGLSEALILLSVFGDRAVSLKNPSAQVVKVVQSLFEKADKKRWWSLSRDFQLLAEASPEAFLTAIEDSLEEQDSPILVLFGEDGGPFGGEHVSGLLWALESLAWDPKYLTRASETLAALASRDPGGNYTNRPKNSLRQIFLLWLPQTQATLTMRLQVLDVIRKKQADVAWQLMLRILPTGHDTTGHSPSFQWRKLPDNKPERVTYALIAKGADELAQRLLDDVGLNPGRWKNLIENLSNLTHEWRAKTIRLLSDVTPQIHDIRARLDIWDALRHCLHHHRSFPGADWSLPTEELNEMETIYNMLQPNELAARSAWLFGQHRMDIPKPNGHDWKANDQQAASLRREAIKEILDQSGIEAVFAFANTVDFPVLVGQALAELSQESACVQLILKRALTGSTVADKHIGHSVVSALFTHNGVSGVSALLEKVSIERWGTEATIRILLALPSSKWAWERAAKAGQEIEDHYWKRVNVIWIDGDAEDISFAVKKLLKSDRSFDAMHMAGHHLKDKHLPNDLLCQVLVEAAKVPSNDLKGNDTVMFEYNIEEIFKKLYQAIDLPKDEIARLEWVYLPILKRSRKRPLLLHKVLATDPKLFVEMLSAMFRPAEDSGIEEAPSPDPERSHAMASQAFDLFHTWHYMPGTNDDGSLDSAALEKWIKDARMLCAQVGRSVIGDQKIGEILAHAPTDAEGVWPVPAVRDVIENVRSRELERGLFIGIHNRRGVSSRGLLDGGAQERGLAQRYRKFAEAAQLKWPRTSTVLEQIARSYEEEGKWHDEDAEKIQW